MQKPKLVLVGNGMAGIRTLEELLAIAPGHYDITVFGTEPHPNYNRILLSPVLAGEQTLQDIVLNDHAWYAEHQIRLLTGRTIVRIDRRNRIVEADDGTCVEYPFDPASKQPELKHAAARLVKPNLPWRLAAFGFPREGNAASLLDELRTMGRCFPFFSASLIGRREQGVLLRLAASVAPTRTVLAEIDKRFGLDGPLVLRYDDAKLGVGRRADVSDGRLRAVRLAGDPTHLANEAWLKEWLVADEAVAAIRRFLLASTATAPAGFAGMGRVVCSCEYVGEASIRGALATFAGTSAATLEHLKQRLRCGTNCGSCLPEIRKMIQSNDSMAVSV